jgi:hypothetical protein
LYTQRYNKIITIDEKYYFFCKTGFLVSMGYQKSEKATLGNYIDKVEVVREVKSGVGVFWLAFRWSF